MFTHSLIDGHLGCFYLLVVMDNVVRNFGTQYLFESLFTIILDLLFREVSKSSFIVIMCRNERPDVCTVPSRALNSNHCFYCSEEGQIV